MRFLTLEFKAELSEHQACLLDGYLERLRIFWNIGIGAIEKLDKFKGYAQSGKEFKKHLAPIERLNLPCCPINWEVRPIETQEGLVFAPYCQILPYEARWYQKQVPRVAIPTPAEQKDSWGWLGGWGYAQPLPSAQDYQQPIIDNFADRSTNGLPQLIKGSNLRRVVANYLKVPVESQKVEELSNYLLDCPYKYRQALMAELSKAYKAYIQNKGNKELNRGKPKKKGKKDGYNTLIHADPAEAIKLCSKSKDTLRGIPKIGKIKLKGLDKRWRNRDGSIPAIKVFKLCKKPNGIFIQLTGELDRSTKTKERQSVCAIDPGLRRYLTLDNGEVYEIPRFLIRSESQLASLQQRLDEKLTSRLILFLNHQRTEIEDLQKLCPNLGHEKAAKLMTSKSEPEMVEIAGASITQALKHRLPQSKKAIALKNKISKLHRKIAQQRRHFAHKTTTFLVRNYGTVVVENGFQSLKMRKKAEAKFDEQGKYTQNQAKLQSWRAKLISDVAPGMLIQLLEEKCKVAGRNFIRFPAKNTTKACPVCFELTDIPIGQYWFTCKHCGWNCDVDQKAGIYMLIQLLEDGELTLDGLSKVVRDTWSLRQKWLESNNGEN